MCLCTLILQLFPGFWNFVIILNGESRIYRIPIQWTVFIVFWELDLDKSYWKRSEQVNSVSKNKCAVCVCVTAGVLTTIYETSIKKHLKKIICSALRKKFINLKKNYVFSVKNYCNLNKFVEIKRIFKSSIKRSKSYCRTTLCKIVLNLSRKPFSIAVLLTLFCVQFVLFVAFCVVKS